MELRNSQRGEVVRFERARWPTAGTKGRQVTRSKHTKLAKEKLVPIRIERRRSRRTRAAGQGTTCTTPADGRSGSPLLQISAHIPSGELLLSFQQPGIDRAASKSYSPNQDARAWIVENERRAAPATIGEKGVGPSWPQSPVEWFHSSVGTGCGKRSESKDEVGWVRGQRRKGWDERRRPADVNFPSRQGSSRLRFTVPTQLSRCSANLNPCRS